MVCIVNPRFRCRIPGRRKHVIHGFHSFLILFVIASLPGSAHPQTVNEQYVVQYNQNESTYYSITDATAKFTDAEIVKLRKQFVSDSIIRSVDVNNDVTTTIFHLIDTRFEQWQTRPAKTIIDPDSVVSFDSAGQILAQQPHSESFIKNYRSLKQSIADNVADLVPDFHFATDKVIKELMSIGFIYSDDGNGNAIFIKDSLEIRINNEDLTESYTIYSGDGNIRSSLKKGFTKNAAGQVVPSFTITKAWDSRFPDQCVRKVVVTDYENYKVVFPNDKQGDTQSATSELIVYPNPADESLHLALSNGIFDAVSIRISDETGIVVIQKQITNAETEIVIPLTKLAPGIYFLHVSDGDTQFNKTFYKS